MPILSKNYHLQLAFPHVLRDAPQNDDKGILERYFIDIQAMLWHKLSLVAMGEGINDEEALKLRALLDEVIKVKRILTKTEEM